MRVVGYGVCGPGEAKKKMRDTMECFKRLCDTTIILLNNATSDEAEMVREYGFKSVVDNREWGKAQWKIKQDLINGPVAENKPDWCITLDMDEVIDPSFTRQSIKEVEPITDSLYFYFVNLWEKGYKTERAFWNIRAWRWTGDTEMKQAALHCGLAPKWAYYNGAYSKYFVLHSGLQTKESRQKKIARYDKYDPTAKFIDRSYYESLKDDSYQELDLTDIKKELEEHWEKYKPKTKKKSMANKKEKFFYVRRQSDGMILDIPEKSLQETLKRGGFTLEGEVIIQEFKELKVKDPVIETNLEQVLEELPVVSEDNNCVICGFVGKNKRSLSMHTKKAH